MVVVGVASLLAAAPAVGSDNIEIHIKAAYLLHFAQFVYWPHSTTTDASTPLVFGVLGHDPMAAILEKTVSGKTASSRPIQVKQFASAEQIDRCDILFLPRSESKQTRAALAAVSNKPIMTVSDSENFSVEGGMVEFLLVDDTVRFAINKEVVERSGLKLSSELLRVAYSIKGKRK